MATGAEHSSHDDLDRRWFLSFLGLIAVASAVAIFLNPYRLLPFDLTVSRINDVKPGRYDRINVVRMFDLANRQYSTVLLGSSRVLYGLSPQSRWLHGPTYNAAVPRAAFGQIRELFDHAVIHQRGLKHIILGIDLFSLNSKFDDAPSPIHDLVGQD